MDQRSCDKPMIPKAILSSEGVQSAATVMSESGHLGKRISPSREIELVGALKKLMDAWQSSIICSRELDRNFKSLQVFIKRLSLCTNFLALALSPVLMDTNLVFFRHDQTLELRESLYCGQVK